MLNDPKPDSDSLNRPETEDSRYIGETEKNLVVVDKAALVEPKPWWKRLFRL